MVLAAPFLFSIFLHLLSGAGFSGSIFGEGPLPPLAILAGYVFLIFMLAAPLAMLAFAIYFSFRRSDLPPLKRFGALLLVTALFALSAAIAYLW